MDGSYDIVKIDMNYFFLKHQKKNELQNLNLRYMMRSVFFLVIISIFKKSLNSVIYNLPSICYRLKCQAVNILVYNVNIFQCIWNITRPHLNQKEIITSEIILRAEIILYVYTVQTQCAFVPEEKWQIMHALNTAITICK